MREGVKEVSDFIYDTSSAVYWPDNQGVYDDDFDPLLDGTFGTFAVHPAGAKVSRKRSASEKSGGGSRSEIRGFSRASKSRMTGRLMGVPWSEYAGSVKGALTGRGVFVTLTYPAVWPYTWAEWKRQLDVLCKRIARRFDDVVGLVWKLEFQRRGAPHFHLVVLFRRAKSVTMLRRWFADNWYDVVASGDEKHHRAGTGVDVIYRPREDGEQKLMSYLLKYMSKELDTDVCEDTGERHEHGRVWGVRFDMPFVTLGGGTCNYLAWCNMIRRLQISRGSFSPVKPETGGNERWVGGYVVFGDGYDLMQEFQDAGFLWS